VQRPGKHSENGFKKSFAKDRAEILARLNGPNASEEFDLVLVGAGIHSSGVAGTLAASAASPQQMKRVLIIDEAPHAISTFYGKSFRINSPEFDNVSTNLLPSAIVQLRDFNAGAGTVEAADLALVGLINLKASGAQVLLDTPVQRLRPLENQNVEITISQNSGDLSFNTRAAGAAIGIGAPSMRGFKDPATREHVTREIQRTRQSENLQDGVYWYSDLLQAITRNVTTSGPSAMRFFQGKDVIIVGPGHSGFISAEPFLGELNVPGTNGKLPRMASSVKLVGLKAENQRQFELLVYPKSGNVHFRHAIVQRYSLRGIGQALNDRYLTCAEGRVPTIRPLPNGRQQVVVSNNGVEEIREADVVILATGHESQSTLQSLLGHENLFSEIGPTNPAQLQVVYGGVQRRRVSIEAVGRQLVTYENGRGKPSRIFVFGGAADLPREPEALAQTLTGNPVSINYLGPKDAAVADQFKEWMDWR
jgi:hypothetical protein